MFMVSKQVEHSVGQQDSQECSDQESFVLGLEQSDAHRLIKKRVRSFINEKEHSGNRQHNLFSQLDKLRKYRQVQKSW